MEKHVEADAIRDSFLCVIRDFGLSCEEVGEFNQKWRKVMPHYAIPFKEMSNVYWVKQDGLINGLINIHVSTKQKGWWKLRKPVYDMFRFLDENKMPCRVVLLKERRESTGHKRSLADGWVFASLEGPPMKRDLAGAWTGEDGNDMHINEMSDLRKDLMAESLEDVATELLRSIR